MKLSRIRFLGTALIATVFIFLGLGVARAAALDAPQTNLHHAKSQSRLRESHHTTARRAATSHSTPSKTAQTAASPAHASATHTASGHSTSSRVAARSTTA